MEIKKKEKRKTFQKSYGIFPLSAITDMIHCN